MLLHSPTQLNYIPQRIISLVPSQTELLFYLGLDNSVGGITKFCIHPPECLPAGQAGKKSKTVVGGTKNINLQKIKNINPDLIIANKEENVKQQIEALAKDYNVWITDVANLTGALQMIKDIGQLTNTSAKATELTEQISISFKNIFITKKKIKTCYLIWHNPYMTIGGDTFIHDMIEKCGFENIYGNEKRYPQLDIQDLKHKGCELLLLSSEPFPFKQKHIDELQPHLPDTKIMFVDGEMFSWYGSRLLKVPEYFKKLIAGINQIPKTGN